MKIVFAVKNYLPNKDGVTNVTRYLAEGLAAYHEVSVITALEEDWKSEENINGVSIYRLNIDERSSKKCYLNKIRELDADCFICVCTQTWCFDWLLGNLNYIKGSKILYTHGFSGLYSYPEELKNGFIGVLKAIKYRIVWELYYRKYSELIGEFDICTHLSVSNKSIHYVNKLGIGNNVVIGNAIEPLFFEDPVCEKNDFDDKKIRYIYVSAFSEMKNQKALLRAFSKMQIQDAELVLVGTEKNSYFYELREMEKRLGLSGKVKYEIGLSREEISRVMSECDICVITSTREAYSIALLEACGKGLPIISTNVGNAHLIPGVIVVNEMEELPYMMDRIGESYALRKKMGELSRKYALDNAQISDKVNELANIIAKIT